MYMKHYINNLRQWQLYEDSPFYIGENEYNTQIDWTEKSNENKQDINEHGLINSYFSNIFQSKETETNPTIQEVICRVNEYI